MSDSGVIYLSFCLNLGDLGAREAFATGSIETDEFGHTGAKIKKVVVDLGKKSFDATDELTAGAHEYIRERLITKYIALKDTNQLIPEDWVHEVGV